MASANCWIWVLFLCLTMLPRVSADDDTADTAAKKLLAALKARDQTLDNAVLRYTKSSEWRVKDTSWRFPPDRPEDRVTSPQVITLIYHEQMVVRGNDTTFISTADPEMNRKNGGTWVTQYRKWGDHGGIFREIADMEGSGGIDYTFETRTEESRGGRVAEERTAIEFTHGFGFGKRIKTIESMIRKADRRVVKGTMQIWRPNNLSAFVIELDDDLVVKKAEIDHDSNGYRTHCEITTEGTVDRDGFAFARTGHFKFVATTKEGRKMGYEPSVMEEFRTRFAAVKFHLRDDVYETLAKIEITPGTLVRDYISNTVYRVEKGGTIKQLGNAVAR